MGYDDIFERLESLSNPQAVEGMAKYGIRPAKTYGVSIPDLRDIAREIGKDHGLAQRLWEAGIRETQILASLVDDSTMVT
ncbi:MAG: DNA alkylation repair protein, partial [Dehalococcoidia bacterium]|nr:DNA alkylation repair protein [Dehalococcoidia bacterium]